MTKLEQITEWYSDEEFLSADGFEEAIIGISDSKLVYSTTKCLDILMKRDGMDELEAQEYFDFNVSGAYMGEKTPIWVDDTMFDE